MRATIHGEKKINSECEKGQCKNAVLDRRKEFFNDFLSTLSLIHI